MKKQKLLLFCSVFVLSFLGLVVFTNQSAFAATKTWDGSAADGKFSTGANWSGNSAPVDGDDVVIPHDVVYASGCSSTVTLDNDLSGVTFGSITGTGEAAGDCSSMSFSIDGATDVSGDILGNSDEEVAPQIRFLEDVTISADATIGAVYGYGGLTIGSHALTLMGGGFAGGVTGSGDISIGAYTSAGGSGGGCSATATPYPFGGDSSGYSGDITVVENGILVITRRTNDVARHASSITAEAGSIINLTTDNNENLTLNTNITLKGGDVYAAQLYSDDCDRPARNKTVTLSGDVTFTANTTIYLNKTNLKFTGSLTGANKLKLADGQDGTVTLANGDALTSDIVVVTISDVDDCYNYNFYSYNNRTNVNVDCAEIIYDMTVYGILGGTGKVGAITIGDGGAIAPGNSPGVLETGNLEFEEGGIYDFEMAGTKTGDYDQIKVAGTVTLGDGTLNVNALDDYIPKVGNKFTIINNDGSDDVDGTFDGLEQGAVFTDDGIQFRISYTGGSGNDVVLTVLSIVDAPDTGSGTFANNPLAIILATLVCSGGMAFVASRYNKGAHAA